jgi:pyruvate dehydrogenase E2 component (dihydrolipoamide acetyltransferase)
MATEITMPKLSDTMTEGQLGAWRKSVGERIERGDIIAEVETDKAVMDLEAFTAGILLEQRVQAGDVIAVGTVIGLIGEPGEEAVPLNVAPAATAESPPAAPSTPPATSAPATESPSPADVAPPAPLARPVTRNIPDDIQAAPIVRRRASELGIDLTTVQGSGPAGRIMLEDLHLAAPAAAAITAAATAEIITPVAAPDQVPLNRMRSAIARTTVNSWQTIPHFYLSRDLEMDLAVKLVQSQQAAGVRVSLNALIMAAITAALLRFPVLNSGYGKEGVINYPHINLAFAVALPDGLQVPVVREADRKNLRELTAAVDSLVEKARKGALTPADISGGSFTVSNLGMFGVDAMVSIIMPGQAAILALGTAMDRPVVHDGQLTVARVMTATLSCDHRIVDGAIAAGFLNEVKRLLEQPAELLA